MSDAEITQAAYSEWMNILARLWESVGKQPEPKQLALYARMLGQVPIGLLEQSITRVIRGHSYANVPTVAEVWTAVRAELGNPHENDVEMAIDNWCRQYQFRYLFPQAFDSI